MCYWLNPPQFSQTLYLLLVKTKTPKLHFTLSSKKEGGKKPSRYANSLLDAYTSLFKRKLRLILQKRTRITKDLTLSSQTATFVPKGFCTLPSQLKPSSHLVPLWTAYWLNFKPSPLLACAPWFSSYINIQRGISIQLGAGCPILYAAMHFGLKSKWVEALWFDQVSLLWLGAILQFENIRAWLKSENAKQETYLGKNVLYFLFLFLFIYFLKK